MQNKVSPDDSFLNMSLAYLEIGRVAAAANTPMRNLNEYNNAIAYQLLHAVELFYKHMIIKAHATVDPIHDIKKLQDCYKSHYTDAVYDFEHPFDFAHYEANQLNKDEKRFAENHLKKFKPEFMSQHLRYPTDMRTGGYSFSLDEAYFKEVKDNIIKIIELAANKSLQRTDGG